jgi:hypothetical protein
MIGRALPDKLMDLCEIRAPEIAERWYHALITNKRTASCSLLDKATIVRQATDFLRNIKKMYFAEDPYRESQRFLEDIKYAQYSYENKVPVQEAVYALIIMRRQLWLYAESQALFFDNAMEIYEILGSVNRTILLFDYAIYFVTQYYAEAVKK